MGKLKWGERVVGKEEILLLLSPFLPSHPLQNKRRTVLRRSNGSDDLAAVRVGSLCQPVALAQAVVDDGHLFFQGDCRIFLGAL